MEENFANWNSHFECEFEKNSLERRRKPGAFLSVVPNSEIWEDYLTFVRNQWRFGRITEFRFCLLTLFAGVAFFYYESGDFWKPFGEAVGAKIPPNQRNELNDYFTYHAEAAGLERLTNSRGNDFVGTAIFQIGVPLSQWREFVKICEVLWWREDWKTFSDDDWEEFIERKIGGLARLKRFLVKNPRTAQKFVEEVHDIRRLIAEGGDEAEIIEISFLRPEHFESAPETEEFISPQKTLSFLNRFQLVFNENAAKISVYLPPVAQSKLPADWKLGELEQSADVYQQELSINGNAFRDKLLLELEGDFKTEKKKLDGIKNWAIFDDETNRLVNRTRINLPTKSYTILSAEPLENIELKGFDDELPTNEKFDLRDDFRCYITRLAPLEQKARISFDCAGENSEIKFRVKEKIEVFLIAGLDNRAAQFRLFENALKTADLPVPCLILPTDLFDGEEVDLAEKFKVLLDEQDFAGTWEKAREDGNQAFYFWCWDENTRARKKMKLTIFSEGLAIKKEFEVEVLLPKPNLADCWANLPDKFLPFVLLAQPNFKSDNGATFDELREIKQIVQPHGRFVSVGFFHFYENLGVLKSIGKRWQFAKSKVYFGTKDEKNFLRFCGNPSVFWQVLRYSADKLPNAEFAKIEVVCRRNEAAYLHLDLTAEQKNLIEKYVCDYGDRYELTKVNEDWEEIL